MLSGWQNVNPEWKAVARAEHSTTVIYLHPGHLMVYRMNSRGEIAEWCDSLGRRACEGCRPHNCTEITKKRFAEKTYCFGFLSLRHHNTLSKPLSRPLLANTNTPQHSWSSSGPPHCCVVPFEIISLKDETNFHEISCFLVPGKFYSCSVSSKTAFQSLT